MIGFLNNYKKYGLTPSSHDLVKFFALIIMITDHIGAYFFPDDQMFRAVGRIGFPVWFFLAGFAKPGKMGKEIIILCLLLIVADILTNRSIFPINALLTIILCRIFSSHLPKFGEKNAELSILFIFMILISFFTNELFEYGTLALTFAAWGYYVRNEPEKLRTKTMGAFVLISFISTQIFIYEFRILESAVMSIGTAVVIYYLQSFKTEFYSSLKDKQYSSIIMILARNTLYLYVLHLISFKIIALILYPENYTELTIFPEYE